MEEMEMPDFLIELKEDQVSYQANRYHFSLQSPGYLFNTPTNNPFCYFQSPSTPKNY
jgi:hypothetical protein